MNAYTTETEAESTHYTYKSWKNVIVFVSTVTESITFVIWLIIICKQMCNNQMMLSVFRLYPLQITINDDPQQMIPLIARLSWSQFSFDITFKPQISVCFITDYCIEMQRRRQVTLQNLLLTLLQLACLFKNALLYFEP